MVSLVHRKTMHMFYRPLSEDYVDMIEYVLAAAEARAHAISLRRWLKPFAATQAG